MKNFIALLFIAFFQLVCGQNQNFSAIKLGTLPFDESQFLGYDAFGFYYTVKNDVFYKIGSGETLEYKNI